MDNLLTRLSDLAEWADANEYEVPINLGDTLREAAEEIKRLTASGTRWISVTGSMPEDDLPDAIKEKRSAHAAQTSLFDKEG